MTPALTITASLSSPPSTFSWAELFRALTFQAGHNTALVVAGTALLGIAGGLVGTLALLRKRSLMGDAISHATLPGIGLAFLIATALGFQGRSVPILMLGGGITAILGVLAIQFLLRFTRLREDAAIAVILSTFFGLGVVIMTVVQSSSSGQQGGLRAYIFGQASAMSASDVWLMASLAVGAALIVALLFKELTLTCFDDEFARAAGWPVGLLDLAIMSLVVIVTLAGIQAVGLVLVIAMLIVPAAAARFWSERVVIVTLLAAALGGLSGYLGAIASSMLDRLPTGGVIVLSAGAIFVLSLVLAPRRGVLATVARRLRLRLSVALDHRVVALTAPTTGPITGSTTGSTTRAHAPIPFIDLLLRLRGLALPSVGSPALTDSGRARAARVAGARQEWEDFLSHQAGIPRSHAAVSADLVEHVLRKDGARP